MGATLDWNPRYVTRYGTGIDVGLFRLSELLAWLPLFIERLGAKLDQTTLVIDGPLGRRGRPQFRRYIDSACRRNGFAGRAFPNDVTGRDGQCFVDATYQIAEPFLNARDAAPWLGGRRPDGLVVAETHPTVGLAVLLPKLDVATLPSRAKRFRVENGNRIVNAKSDWYWLRGAGRVVASLLGEMDVSQETHHERRAALYCLAVARSLGRGQALALGRAEAESEQDDTGVYVVSSPVHAHWQCDFARVGIVWGERKWTCQVPLIDIAGSFVAREKRCAVMHA